jgi:hypothetical protein
MHKILVGVAAVGVALSLSTPVQAAEKAPKSQLMNQSDLKPFGGVVNPAKWYWSVDSADSDLINSVCIDSQGKTLTFDPANGWVVGGVVSLKPYTSITEHVFEYPTNEAQAAAWQQLQTAAASCDTKTTEKVSSGDPSLYYNVTQSVTDLDAGVAITERSVARTKDKRINGSSTVSYTTYRKSGTAIIMVSYYQNPGKAISAGKKAQVDALADTLNSRWSTS